MMIIETLEDIATMQESVDVECKLAQGRDGRGEVPRDMWRTYSAFANSDGGNIFLGLREKADHSFELAGIADTQKVLKALWDTCNNPQKVSVCVLCESGVRILEVAGKSIVHIRVPPASREQKPVYVNGNPLTGTFRRFNSGDMQAGEIVVRRMLAEQVEESRDTRMLQGYGMEDLDTETINTYRNMYSARQPDHLWNRVDTREFLYQIGALGKDRDKGTYGLTLAGLLMFGQYRSIMDAFPHYMLDYQEQESLEVQTEIRWIDRLVPDGSWSGNLFDFYRSVIRKLTVDLKVPFVLEGDQRQDDTPVHKALREALVNTLIHADYTGTIPVLVVKRPDMFSFRNPGAMRVVIEDAIAGSISDCRNRLLQNMFRYLGLGESAGSGLPKIFDGWKSQHWRRPRLTQKLYPAEQTQLELHTLSLIPELVLERIRNSLGDKLFRGLGQQELPILATAEIEKTVDHARMMSIMDIHPRDLSACFAALVDKGILYKEGSGRGTVYFTKQARLEDLRQEAAQYRSGHRGEISGPLGEVSGPQGEISGPQGEVSGPRGEVSGPRGEVSGPRGEVSGPRGEVSGPLGEVSGPQGEVSGPRGEVSGPQGEVSGPQGEVSGPQGEVSGPQGEVSEPQGEVSGPQGEVSGPRGEVSGPQGEVSGPRGEVSGPQGEVSGPQGEVSGPQGEVSGPQGEVSGPRGEVSGPQGEVSGPQGEVSGPLDAELVSLAAPVASSKRVSGSEMRRVLLALCARRALTLEDLERLLKRNGEYLSKYCLRPLLKKHKIRLRYPTRPNHPQQAYISSGS